MHSFRLQAFAVFLLSALLAAGVGAQAPELASRAAILIDATTGTVLFEKNADLEIPPASLTKLMTIHVTLAEAAAGRLRLDDVVRFGREAWAVNQPWRSSLMFLAPGQTVSLHELLLGLAVSSGNDAAIAVASHVSGSVEKFVELMNEETRAIGLEATRFVEPSGISEKNMTTAREFAEFCRYYLERNPRALSEYHSVKEFAYPKPENVPQAFRDSPGTIVQYNRNLLLGEIEGVDGLKTGFIVESGYNIALTAERGGTRLLAVLLGGPGASSTRGGRIRADDGGRLLSWGFERFRTIRPEIERLEDATIWKGTKRRVALEAGARLEFTASPDRAREISYAVTRMEGITAPVAKGARLGELVFSDGSGPLKSVPLVAAEAVELGNPFRRFADSIALFFLRLFGKIS